MLKFWQPHLSIFYYKLEPFFYCSSAVIQLGSSLFTVEDGCLQAISSKLYGVELVHYMSHPNISHWEQFQNASRYE